MKAKIILVKVGKSQLKHLEGKTIYRTTGRVTITKVYATRLEYTYVGESTAISSFNYEGFYIPVVYTPGKGDDCFHELHSNDWDKLYIKPVKDSYDVSTNQYKQKLTNVYFEDGLARLGNNPKPKATIFV